MLWSTSLLLASGAVREGEVSFLTSSHEVTLAELEEKLSALEQATVASVALGSIGVLAAQKRKALQARIRAMEIRAAAIASNSDVPPAVDLPKPLGAENKDASWLAIEERSGPAAFGLPAKETDLPGPRIPFFVYTGAEFDFGLECRTQKTHPNW